MTQPVRRQPFTATITGSPRIGPRRELKRATEGYWAGRTSRSELEAVAATLRRDTWSALAAAGLDSVPVNTFSYYDQMLDTAVLLGALPPRVSPVSDGLDRYFAAARGTDQIAPLEMTKWFDTNYHYLVPEIGPSTTFTLHPGKVLAELKEALGQGIPARPVIIGPITFLLLSKAVDARGAPIERLEELVPVYSELLSLLADGGAQWVQFDEPALVTDLSPDAPALAEAVYTALCSVSNRPAIYVATYFGDRAVLGEQPACDLCRHLLRGPARPRAGVDTDQLVRVSTAEPFDERHQPRDLGVDVDAFTRAGFDTADVDDVGTVGDGPVDRVSGSRVAESRTLVVKRIRGAVDDRHDQRTITCDWTAAQR